VDVKFVEAQQGDAIEPLPRHRAEPVVAARFVDEPPVYLAQKFVEVDAAFGAFGQFEHGIDYEALAASGQAVAIDTQSRWRMTRGSAPRGAAEQRDECGNRRTLAGVGHDRTGREGAHDASFVNHGAATPAGERFGGGARVPCTSGAIFA